MKLIGYLAFMASMACGQERVHRKHTAMHDEIAWFENNIGPVNSEVHWGSVNTFTKMPAAGLCWVQLNRIEINREVMGRLDKYQRRALLAHEVLHCQYGKDHVVDRLSIMNTALHDELLYRSQWPYFVHEILALIRGGRPSHSPLPLYIERSVQEKGEVVCK